MDKNIQYNEPKALMGAKEFKSLLNNSFAPIMRRHGFKGSGFSFTKNTGDHYIYCLNIQGSRYGGACCIEMGVHIDFIPSFTNENVDIKRFSAFNSDFRTRLTPELENDYWWGYGNSPKEAMESIESMKKMFEAYGIPFFNQFINFPEPLIKVTIEDLEKRELANTEKEIPAAIRSIRAYGTVRLAMQLARVYNFTGDIEKSKKFADWGLKNVGRGTALIPIFEELIEGKSAYFKTK